MSDKFEELAQEAINQAEGIDCPFEEFVAGLRLMYELVHNRYIEAREELTTKMDPRGEEDG
jgi:hypothetical protein